MTKKKSSRGKFFDRVKRRMKQAVLAALAVYVLSVMGKGMFATRSFTLYAPEYAAAQEEIVPDACSAAEVICEGETAKPFTTEEKIRAMFPEQPEEVRATFQAESSLNPRAKGWNCYYYRADGTRYSTSCREEDRGKAWSVDCGVAQINVSGQECPEELYNVDHNLKVARSMYVVRGLSPWWAWKNGKHKQYL